ncbi:suppressor for copper-sensitivity B [Thalassospira sp. TSL5-1]|nr:suppressor for copper-sensitivity B [Thalassospira sp. TSL5-1]
MKRILTLLIVILLPHLAQAAPAASAWQDEDFASVRVISARDGVKDVHTLRLGLEFALKPHWKIYWRSAGDAGFPPSINWQGSENIDSATATMIWPAPIRFSIFGLETFGYQDRVILPIDVPVQNSTDPVVLKMAVDYLACSDICVPATANLTLDLPADQGNISNHAHEIEKFAAKVPLKGHNLPIGVSNIWESSQDKNNFLNVTLRDIPEGVKPDILVEGKPTDSFGAPVATGQSLAGTPIYQLAIHNNAEAETLAGQNVTVTVLAGDLAVEQPVTIGDAPADGMVTGTLAPAANENGPHDEAQSGFVGPSKTAWWVIGGLALLGGLILNVMPCVLPVLSIKVMGAIQLGAQDRRGTRRGFLASAAGIMVSFWIIAGALAILKLAGGSIGWGIQFQQPLFLTTMTIIVVLFACNMFGLFEISANHLNNLANNAIDQQNSRAAQAPGNADTPSAQHQSMGGHFLTGMFATLLATPCSAPFLGTAVGFALAGSIFDIFWVFSLLGLGFAVPYLLIAARPEIARLLPKPGRWMAIVKFVLGLALLGTAIWLLSILANQIGLSGAIVVGLGLALASGLIWWRHVTSQQRRKPVLAGLATLAVLMALFAPGFSRPPSHAAQTASTTDTPNDNALPWQPFAPDKISQLVGEGKTVLVDITADWCVTCQVNKRLVIDTDAVRSALQADNVVLMQGDWTRPDPEIAAFLAKYDRYGIPFNAIYGPQAPGGILLSELLSKDQVISGLKAAQPKEGLANNQG